MTRLIVQVEHGIVTGVYTDSPSDLDVRIKDSINRNEESKEPEYFKLQRLIDQGCLENILLKDPIAVTEQADVPIMLDADVFLIIREPNEAKTESGRQLQRLHAAYIDGYLKAQAELFQFIMKLRRSKNEEDAQNGQMLLRLLEPLRNQQNEHYDALCEYVNRPDIHDNTER